MLATTSIARPRVAFSAILALLLLCLAAASAGANGTASLSADSTTLTFTSGVGEKSDITVAFDTFGYTIEDATSGVSPGAGCVAVNGNAKKVSCATAATTLINLNMGDNADSVMMGAAAQIPSYVETTVNDVGSVTGGDGAMVINSDGNGGFPGAWSCNVTGGSSYDTINVSTGVCNIDGGDKDDQINISNKLDKVPDLELDPTEQKTQWYQVSGGPGADVIDASDSTGNLRYVSSPGIDILMSGQGNDEIVFGDGQDLIFGNGGDDRFYNNGGHTDAESNKSEIWGGPGNDTFTDMDTNTLDVTHYEGGPGVDRVTYRTYDGSKDVRVTLDSSPTSNDDGVMLPGGASEGDHIHASVENIGGYTQLMPYDQMFGNDTLVGSDRANSITAGAGNDTVDGKGGNDTLIGAEGKDSLSGGAGDDTLTDGTGSTTFDGGTGTDKASLATSSYGITANLNLTSVQATTDPATDPTTNTFIGIENIDGSSHDDTLTGNSDPNKLNGKNGNDTIKTTGGGIDTITCGTGTDTVDADTTDVITDASNCESVTLH